MVFGSVCSGIEAASVAWNPLGWRCAFMSEIDKFPRAVLAQHYPDTPLHGDFTTIEAGQYEPIDLLVGGTPCQDFSVAGLRAGIAGDRGNLTLEFIKLLKRLNPHFFVWENVPGVLSLAGGGTFRQVLDGFEDAGYILDVDVLDAQFHGLAQRRRRVYVCGQHRDNLISQKTTSSALTIAQCWLEILLGILAARSTEFASALGSSACPSLSGAGAQRKMTLFGVLGDQCTFEKLRENLVAECRRQVPALQSLDCRHGTSAKERTREDQSTDLPMAAPFTLTERSLSAALAESYQVVKSFTTWTTTNSITQREIYICSRAALLIAKLILASNRSSPPFWSAALSSLTAMEAFTDYARSASSSLFTDMAWLQPWSDFLREAEPTSDTLGDIGIECFEQIFPISQSLSGNPAPRREAGQGFAPTTSFGISSDCFDRSGEGAGGTPGERPGLGIVEEASPALRAKRPNAVAYGGNNTAGPIDVATAVNAHGVPHGRQDFESETFIAHTLRAEGFDASEDGPGRGIPLVPMAWSIMPQNSTKDFKARPVEASQPLMAGGPVSGNQGGDYIQEAASVRRLTPRECERLQGFPDDYTLITYRGKPAADGPRYKTLGNSMAVPVMAWIGRRIELVERLVAEGRAA